MLQLLTWGAATPKKSRMVSDTAKYLNTTTPLTSGRSYFIKGRRNGIEDGNASKFVITDYVCVKIHERPVQLRRSNNKQINSVSSILEIVCFNFNKTGNNWIALPGENRPKSSEGSEVYQT